jgi:iron complex transport system substrate-binding protein
MEKKISKTLSFIFISFVFACGAPTQKSDATYAEKIKPKYAKGFSISFQDNYKIINVYPYWQKGDTLTTLKYVLLKQGQDNPTHLGELIPVNIPIKSMVCLSTTHAPLVDLLGESKKIIGFSGNKYISNLNIKALIQQGKIKEVGRENGTNVELILDLQPQLVMSYDAGQADNTYQQMQKAGLKVALNNEFLEETPLGKAEWLKFVATFFDKDRQADSIFSAIEQEYIQTFELAQKQTNKPTVFSNIPYGNTWYVAGGKSFATRFFQDAGANYIFADDSTRGSAQMSIETVFQKAQNADFWLNVSNYNSLQELKSTDNRFVEFKAFRDSKVYNNNLKVNENGGIEYWELGVARPDLVLKDLVKIFYPDLLPTHQFYFYKQLE